MRIVAALPKNPRCTTALVAFAAFLFVAAEVGAEQQENERPQAPAGYSIFESDMAGSWFVAKPLKEKYDNLRKRVGELKLEIDGAQIDETTARREIDRMQSEIDETIREIDKAKLYVPGATVRSRAVDKSVPLAKGDLLFVEAENVEIRGGDGPEMHCAVKKTVLGDLGREQDLTADFEGIELVVRKTSGKEMFGFYKDAALRPDLKHFYVQFPFKPFLDREFTVVTIKGLTYEEGNRQVQISVKSEQGDGRVGSEWRRHAKLILTVPKCQGVGVRGALGGFRAHALSSPLSVEGSGNRDYQTRYDAVDLRDSFTASNIPIHRIDGVKGDVSIVDTAYAENSGTSHGPDGVAMRPYPPRESSYRNIQGDLRVWCCRADLTIENVEGRVDIANDFGKTVWRAVRPIAGSDHRIVSQSGAIDVRFAPAALGKLALALFTECGAVRLPQGDSGFQSLLGTVNTVEGTSRYWRGFFSAKAEERAGELMLSFRTRIPAAARGEKRPPGIDIISRAGTITCEPIGAGASGP
jgi:hypothetical protein